MSITVKYQVTAVWDLNKESVSPKSLEQVLGERVKLAVDPHTRLITVTYVGTLQYKHLVRRSHTLHNVFQFELLEFRYILPHSVRSVVGPHLGNAIQAFVQTMWFDRLTHA